MTLHVIGAGVGRTGTQSLKNALDQLGLGPTHHMDEVIKNPVQQIPLWSAALGGYSDWSTVYEGFASAVDWPTASFWEELVIAYPKAKVILSVRDPERWAESFLETINKLLSSAEAAPPQKQPFLKMVQGILSKAGFSNITSKEDAVRIFNSHSDRVRKGVPADRLLVYDVRDGWEPLCGFLERPVPEIPFPRTNTREDFWTRVQGE